MRIRRSVMDFFGCTPAEANGAIGLLVLLCIGLGLPQILHPWLTADTDAHRASDLAQLEAWRAELTFSPPPAPTAVRRFAFDPNHATPEEWEQLGAPPHLARRIANYRAKGGQFRRADDLARIYDFPDTLLTALRPYITLPSAPAQVMTDRPIRKARTVRRFAFDPNDATAEEWEQLGATPHLARRIVNYRAKGGQFRRADDLARIYDFPDTLLAALRPYIILPAPEAPLPTAPTRTVLAPFDLNAADTLALRRIRGIGPALARRVVAYRTALGGFRAPDQVREVWGLPDSVVTQLLTLGFVAEDFGPQRLSLNHSDEATLADHPYLSLRQARALVAYRAQHGPFRQVEDLRQLHVLSPEDVARLLPYVVAD